GSLRDAVLAAGLDPERLLRRLPWPRHELVDLVRQLAEKQPTMTLTELHRSKLGTAIVRRYGTLSKGLRRLGFDDWPIRVLFPAPSKKQVIDQLRRRYWRGAAMAYTAVCNDDRRLLTAATKQFGSFRAAMQASGLGKLLPKG